MESVDTRSPRAYACIVIGAAILLILGVVLSLQLGFVADDPSAAIVPDWQFATAWTMVIVGLIVLVIALLGWWRRSESSRSKTVLSVIGGAVLVLFGVPALVTAVLYATS